MDTSCGVNDSYLCHHFTASICHVGRESCIGPRISRGGARAPDQHPDSCKTATPAPPGFSLRLLRLSGRQDSAWGSLGSPGQVHVLVGAPSLLPVAQAGMELDFVSTIWPRSQEDFGKSGDLWVGSPASGCFRIHKFGWALGKCHLSAQLGSSRILCFGEGAAKVCLQLGCREMRGMLGLGCRLLHLKGQVVLKLLELFLRNLMCPSVFISVLLLSKSPHYIFLIPVCP